MTMQMTRQSVEAAEPLAFDQPKPKKWQRAITVQLVYRGVPITISYSAADNIPIPELEQAIDTMLRREGWAPPVRATNGQGLTAKGNPKAEYIDPIYDGDGEACCPVHRTPLRQGRYGWFCASRAREGELANDKGYCALRFKE